MQAFKLSSAVRVSFLALFVLIGTFTFAQTSAAEYKRVSASGLGGGKFLGETSGGAGDIIRVHENELNTSATIDANNNGLAAGPLTIASGVTLTISGELSVV